MGKLHELLAVEGSLKGQADKTRKDLMLSMDKKRHLFTEKRVTFQPTEDGADIQVEERSDLQNTIRGELRWLSGIIKPALDASFQIADANTRARADVVIDGKVLLKDASALALLELEKRANELHEFVSAIPTLDPAKGFTLDPDRGENIYKAREVTKLRTQKRVQPLVLSPATDKHPAQVKEISVDVPIGKIQEQEWSGLITPAEKSELIGRAEKLVRALKQARARANEQTVNQELNIGGTLLDYVFG